MSRILVLGAGKSGVASANYLAQRGDDVVLTDVSAHPNLPFPLDPRVAREFGRDDDALLDGITSIVLSPGVPMTIPLLQHAAARAIPVIGEIELAYRNLKGTIIAVTGSNGKSTTTALIGEILRVAGRQPIVAGNIGEPLIAALDPDKARTYVLELSSFQLESVDTFHADIALLLNITPDHMDRYPNFDAYAAAKYRIFRNQRSGDVAIVNGIERRSLARETPGRVWRFSATKRVDEGAWLDGDQLVLSVGGDTRRIPRASLALQGTANVENALAAWLAARAAGVDDVDVQIAFGTFQGLPHRMVLVRELDGVRWINDSKGTNVDATLKSLESFGDGSVILILGGKDKAGEFERMRDLVAAKARAVLTIGHAAERIGEALEGSSAIVPSEDMQRAVAWARANAKSGETVLLSPACASFDQYRNFEHRGEHFEELVRAL
ncbi:MAG: UDP-N-acetylmuramoyl-L-alanine--D-glutamate ligase [Acidobacteria bacterium]|nr:UDP-N-acetylmuramoyl-L-alanine--D-glutamate ligase [Acidobacteriota bacterium]MBV9476207.1 UDP-N-acetylmuramoyl-L-alanine--D-glutamate ligase [Acidobacteriota bacterium]